MTADDSGADAPAPSPSARRRLLRWQALLPLVAFLALVIALAFGMRRDPRLLPSPLLDRPAPAFVLDDLQRQGRRTGNEAWRGRVVLLNVWASWCSNCRDEHPLLMALARDRAVPVYGLDYRDERAAALQTLARQGDPYVTSFYDSDGRTAIDFGVYGVPETFVIDAAGVIRYKHVGAVTDDVLRETILPLVARLRLAGVAPP